MRNAPALENLCELLAGLPGIGRRSAERLAFSLLTSHKQLLPRLLDALRAAADTLACCRDCGGLTKADENPCRLCTDPRRDDALLCVVEDPADIRRIEQSGAYRGRYHALMGRLSPMGGMGAGDLRLAELFRRIETGAFREVVLALNSNVESDATAGFIGSRLRGMAVGDLRVSRPAQGIPSGGGIAYADALTLASALEGRRPV